jgi:hypothetical protein
MDPLGLLDRDSDGVVGNSIEQMSTMEKLKVRIMMRSTPSYFELIGLGLQAGTRSTHRRRELESWVMSPLSGGLEPLRESQWCGRR